MKRKNILSIVVCLVALFISLGTTVAYLTTENGLISFGNETKVLIEQIEKERSSTGLIDFRQNKLIDIGSYDEENMFEMSSNYLLPNDIYPNGASVTFWDENVKNEIDKIVSVFNHGNCDIYVRTIFAFPNDIPCILNVVQGDIWEWELIDGYTTIDDAKYRLAVATYIHNNGIVRPGEGTYPSLLQAVINKDISRNLLEDRNEMKILAYSQAVETNESCNAKEELELVLGTISNENNPFIMTDSHK